MSQRIGRTPPQRMAPVPPAAGRRSEQADSAQLAMDGSIEPLLKEEMLIAARPASGTSPTPTPGQLSLDVTASEPATTYPEGSLNFDVPVRPSKKRYRSPRNAMELASLVSKVAVQVLNGDIEIEKARTFSGLVRTAAQAMTTETARARSEKSIPELVLAEDDLYES